MDQIRGRLIAKIDEILAQVVTQDTPLHSQLQLEANLVLPQDPTQEQRRVLLESIDIDQLRHYVASHSGTPMPQTPAHPLHHQDDFASVGNTPPAIPAIPAPHTMSVSHVISDNNHSLPVATNASFASATTISALPYTRHMSPQPSAGMTPPLTPPVNVSKQSADNSYVIEDPFHAPRPDVGSRQTNTEKLIEGIWEQLHNLKTLALDDDELRETMQWVRDNMAARASRLPTTNFEFNDATKCCRRITTGSRTARALEVVIQAHWIDCFDARLAALKIERADLKLQEHKKQVLTEACTSFSWTEKELRNRMAIWKGYREIKDAAGWVALIFAGPGIYRFCKYRQGFDQEAMLKFRALRIRAEVTADTLQPQWRQLLSLVNEPSEVHWTGHPHDWTVHLTEGKQPLPLAVTYHQWDPEFSFHHLEESTVDTERWHGQDPRRFEEGLEYWCNSCTLRQSSDAEVNACECYPDLYSPNPRKPCPVQIFRTENGKNNGLIACCSFATGQAVGEFLGLITKGLANMDVMQNQAGDNEPYQIYQGRCGNFTRFINHSCEPNCQFQTFSWLGIQRVVVVSKGVTAEEELTVDYSNQYWEHLDKICLCGAPGCRYSEPRARPIN